MQNVVVEKNSLWQHFKGSVMKVLEIAKNSETLEEMVIYEHDGTIWTRPISSFLSNEDVSSRVDNVTKQKYRFELIKGGKEND